MGWTIYLVIFDMTMGLIMFLLGYYFYRSNGKAAILLTGYNMRSEEERKKFDEDAMCKEYGKRMMRMAVPFVFGAAIDIFWQGAGCTLAWSAWMVMFVLLLIKRWKMEK